MRCFGLLVTLLHISSKTADDIVENNDQVILAGLEAETFWVIGTYDNDYNSLVTPLMDKMAEWLKRWTVNPLVSARMGSNPIFVVFLIGSML